MTPLHAGRSRRRAAAALLLLVPALLACPRAPEEPDIVLVVVDTLRADALGAYGQPLPTSPAIDRLSRAAVLYEEVQTVSPWTKPTIATILTGLYPRQHGVRRGLRRDDARTGRVDVLPEGIPTLPERLGSLGYDALALQANPHCDARSGFGRGFREYRELPFAGAPVLSREAVPILSAPREKPLFLMVHLLDPHTDYRPRLCPFAPEGGLREMTLDGLRNGARDPGLVEAAHLTYLSEVYECSGAVDALRRAARGRPAALVVTSDHGEEFLEHGGLEHGHSLHEELLRVPLVVALPGAVPRLEPRRASLRGLFDTLVSVPAGDGSVATGGLLASEALLYGPDGVALVDGEAKLIATDGAPERLYDLARDPREASPAPLARSAAERLATWREDFLRLRPAREAVDRAVDPEEEERLKSLGYAGP